MSELFVLGLVALVIVCVLGLVALVNGRGFKARITHDELNVEAKASEPK